VLRGGKRGKLLPDLLESSPWLPIRASRGRKQIRHRSKKKRFVPAAAREAKPEVDDRGKKPER